MFAQGSVDILDLHTQLLHPRPQHHRHNPCLCGDRLQSRAEDHAGIRLTQSCRTAGHCTASEDVQSLSCDEVRDDIIEGSEEPVGAAASGQRVILAAVVYDADFCLE